MKDIFQIEDKHNNVRHKDLVKNNNVRSVNFGNHTASSVVPEFRIKCVKIQIHF